MSSESQAHYAIPPFVVKATTIASLGGLLYGFDLGCISGALPQIVNAFELTERQSELVVSFLYIGGGLGSAIGGSLCDTAGRRAAILVTDVVFLLGAAILYFSPSLTIVLLGRIVMGFGVAVSAIADVSYLHEISPPEWRGSIVSVNEACISFGFLVAYIVAYLVTSVDPIEGWRTIFGVSGFVAVIQFIGMLAMPESPGYENREGNKKQMMHFGS
jgi:MFS family permease